MSARPPMAPPRSAVTGLLLGALLVALGVVLVQGLLVFLGALGGPAWPVWVVDALDGLTPGGWSLGVAVALLLVGVVLVLVALTPRRRTHVLLDREADVWATPAALAALAEDAADRVSGVSESSAAATRRGKVKVRVTAADPGPVEPEVRSAVSERVGAGTKVKIAVSAHAPREREDRP